MLLTLQKVQSCISNTRQPAWPGALRWWSRMNFLDIDWRSVLNEFSEEDLRYLRAMIDEKLERSEVTQRRAIILSH